MTCHTCNKKYQTNYGGGVYYFDTWWKNVCKSCQDEFVVCSSDCRFNHCQKCKRDINIDTILTHEQQLES